MRALYVTGSVYLALSAFVLVRQHVPTTDTHGPSAVATFTGDAGQWFQSMKPYCNSVEVETVFRRLQPPNTLEGAGYSAACYALAGKIDAAREIIIEQVDQDERWRAAGIVFNVGHPVADAGDDESAGPIMELVVEFWPNHYMALYHAGISHYELGRSDLALTRLRSFLNYYDNDDGWRQNAQTVIERIEHE